MTLLYTKIYMKFGKLVLERVPGTHFIAQTPKLNKTYLGTNLLSELGYDTVIHRKTDVFWPKIIKNT